MMPLGSKPSLVSNDRMRWFDSFVEVKSLGVRH
jgi:hypothetical protein